MQPSCKSEGDGATLTSTTKSEDAMAELVELYHHHQSVCAAKSRLALDEKGLEWTGHLISLRDSEQHTPE